jgi:hypothetical protein
LEPLAISIILHPYLDGAAKEQVSMTRSSNLMHASNEEREKFIILLLGAVDRPIPTLWHVQKELFVLSKANPKLQDLFHFEKHYEGAFSQVLHDLVREPCHHEEAYTSDSSNGGLRLTQNGRKIYKQILQQYANNEKFIRLLDAIKLIREMYDKLSKDELLFLMYLTYPDYVEMSNIYDRLVNDKAKRRAIAESLHRKRIVTDDRFRELLSYLGTLN